MFNLLRVNSPIYLFHKTLQPSLETGYVLSIIGPRPKYTVPASILQSQEYVIDLTVKIADKTVNYKNLPALQEVYEFYEGTEPLVLSDSKSIMNQEVLNHKQRSIDALNLVEGHKSSISACENIIMELNPEYAEKELLKEEISSLKELVSLLSDNMKKLMETNLKLVERLGKEEKS